MFPAEAASVTCLVKSGCCSVDHSNASALPGFAQRVRERGGGVNQRLSGGILPDP